MDREKKRKYENKKKNGKDGMDRQLGGGGGGGGVCLLTAKRERVRRERTHSPVIRKSNLPCCRVFVYVRPCVFCLPASSLFFLCLRRISLLLL